MTPEERAQRLEALRLSWHKWNDIARGAQEDLGPDNCALCLLYWRATREYSCIGCPIREYIGRVDCRGTPYYRWSFYVDILGNCTLWAFDDTAARLALEMRDFIAEVIAREKVI